MDGVNKTYSLLVTSELKQAWNDLKNEVIKWASARGKFKYVTISIITPVGFGYLKYGQKNVCSIK